MIAEFLLFLVIFIGIMTIASLIFGGWIIAMLFRGIAGLLGLGGRPMPGRRPSGAVQIGPVPSAASSCSYELCRTPNEPGARYCRRCGRPMPAVQPVRVRRAALW